MSPFTAAIVANVLGDLWTDLGIVEFTVSDAEDPVYVRKAGGVGFDGVQRLTDVRNNRNRQPDAAGVMPDERREAVRLFNQRISITAGNNV